MRLPRGVLSGTLHHHFASSRSGTSVGLVLPRSLITYKLICIIQTRETGTGRAEELLHWGHNELYN